MRNIGAVYSTTTHKACNGLNRTVQGTRSSLERKRADLRRHRLVHLELDVHHEVVAGHKGPVLCADLSESTKPLLLSGSIDRTICLYALGKFEQDDGNLTTRVEAQKRSEVARADASVPSHIPPRGHSFGVSSVQWYPTDPGAFISSGYDAAVLLWDTETFQPVMQFHAASRVSSARIRAQPDDILIAVACDEPRVTLCDVLSGANTHTFHGHSDAITYVEWSPSDPHILASACRDGSVRLWDVRRSGQSACLLVLDWLQDHTAKEVGSLFRRVDRRKEHIAKAHDGAITSLAFAPNGRTLMTSGNGWKIRAWDTNSGALYPFNYRDVSNESRASHQMKVVRTSSNPYEDIFFCPAGPSGDVHGYRLFSEDGMPIVRLKGHFDSVHSICVKETSQQLLTAANDGLILLWSPRGTPATDTSPGVTAKSHNSGHTYGSGFISRSGELSYAAPDRDDWSDDENNDEPIGGFIPPIVRHYLSNPRTRLAQAVASRDQQWLRDSLPLYSGDVAASNSSQQNAPSDNTVASEPTEAGGFIVEAGVASTSTAEVPEGGRQAKRRLSIRAKLEKRFKNRTNNRSVQRLVPRVVSLAAST